MIYNNNERRRSCIPVRRFTHRSTSNQDAQIGGRTQFFKREDRSPARQRQVALRWMYDRTIVPWRRWIPDSDNGIDLKRNRIERHTNIKKIQGNKSQHKLYSRPVLVGEETKTNK